MAVALRTLSRTSKTTKIDPQKDPRYRRVVEQLKAKASKIKQHPSPARKAAQAAAAAKGPLNEKKAGAKANQVDKIKEAKEKKPEPSSFLTLLRAEIEKAMPKTLGDTEKFMKGGTAEELKGSLKGNVGKQKEEATGDVKTASKETPSEAGVTGKEVTPIPGEPAPASPVVAGAEAMPAPKPDAEISLQESKADTAQAMKDAEVTDTQLQRANDPRFSAVLSAKGNVAAQADKAPAQYRASEQASLSRAATVAGADARKGAALMVGVKSSSNSAVLTRQQIAKAKDEAARKKVADDIEAIYNETKTRVEQKLGTLEGEVSSLFDNGTTTALKTMKESVETRLERYKRDRYGFSLTGVANWTRDLFMGLPEEVNEFYVEARKNFTLEMDALIVRVANLVETRLKEAKQEVARGQERIKLYVAALPQNLQSVGKSAQKEVADRFSELERGIEDKKNQLAEQLASKYKDASDKAEAALKVIQDANKGLVQVFAEKLGEVLRILKEFKEKVMVLVRKAEETIKLIVADPIRFLGNLLLAVKKGINQFVSNIATHLKTGFFNWLFGTLAKAGITMPKDSSLPSILKLVLDVLGITYDKMRVKAVKLIGERNVAIIEKVGALISFLISGGLTRLWEMAKESLGNIKETIMEMIRGSLITQIIQSAVVKLLSMFNPAGAIIQAITIIYDTIMFFVDNIDRILDFAKAVIDSIYDVVTGSVDKAANWIEKAMGKMVPILIGFLARLIGLGGISDKIKVIIIKLQERVDKAIDKIIAKVVASVKKLFGKLTGKKDEDPEKKAKIQAGLQALDKVSQTYKTGATIDLLKGPVAKVKQQHPVFKTLSVIKSKQGLLYEYSASPTTTHQATVDADKTYNVMPHQAAPPSDSNMKQSDGESHHVPQKVLQNWIGEILVVASKEIKNHDKDSEKAKQLESKGNKMVKDKVGINLSAIWLTRKTHVLVHKPISNVKPSSLPRIPKIDDPTKDEEQIVITKMETDNNNEIIASNARKKMISRSVYKHAGLSNSSSSRAVTHEERNKHIYIKYNNDLKSLFKAIHLGMTQAGIAHIKKADLKDNNWQNDLNESAKETWENKLDPDKP